MRYSARFGRWSAALAALWTLVWFTPVEAQERFRRTPPLGETRQAFRLEAIGNFTMPNGLKVAVAVRPRTPLVTLQVIIGAGEADSPDVLPGVASLTARMIGHRTKLLSSSQIADLIESLGADYSVTVMMDYTVFRIEVLGEFLDRALLAIRLMLLQPVFSERDLAVVRRNVTFEHLDRKKDPEFLGWRHLLRLLFEGHAYQSGAHGEEAFRSIDAKDLQAFYGRYYMPNNAVITISGDVETGAVAKKVGDHFSGWRRRELQKRPLAPPPANARERICYIESADCRDATILAGNVVMDPSNPDYFPFLVLNQALGGTPRSRLFMNLRESKGYAYYAFSEAEFYRACGVFWARTRVTPEFIQPAVHEILRELKAFSTDRPPAPEIEEAKAYLVGNLPLKFESLRGFSDWMARVAALGLNSAHWNRLLENIMVVNIERVQAVGQKYLLSTPLVVIVGRREWILDSVADFRVVEVYDNDGTLKQTILKPQRR